MKRLMVGVLAASALFLGCRGGNERGGSYDRNAPTVDGRRDESHGENTGTGGSGGSATSAPKMNDPSDDDRKDPGEGLTGQEPASPAEEPAEDGIPRQ